MKRQSEHRESDQLAVIVHRGAYIRLDRNSHGQALKFSGDDCSHTSNYIWLNAPLRFRKVSVPEFKAVVAAAVRC